MTREIKGWGRTLYNEFKKRGYDTYALNPHAMAPEGIRCYGSLSKLSMKVDGVLLAMSPRVTDQVVREAATLGISRVWMHKGAGVVSKSAIQFCQEKNITTVYGVCPFMYLQP